MKTTHNVLLILVYQTHISCHSVNDSLLQYLVIWCQQQKMRFGYQYTEQVLFLILCIIIKTFLRAFHGFFCLYLSLLLSSKYEISISMSLLFTSQPCSINFGLQRQVFGKQNRIWPLNLSFFHMYIFKRHHEYMKYKLIFVSN